MRGLTHSSYLTVTASKVVLLNILYHFFCLLIYQARGEIRAYGLPFFIIIFLVLLNSNHMGGLISSLVCGIFRRLRGDLSGGFRAVLETI